MTFDDDAIAAYFAGTLSPEDSAAFEGQVERDPAFAQHVMALDPAQATVAMAFDQLTPPAIALPDTPRQHHGWLLAAAAAVALIAIGIGTFAMNDKASPDWHVQVAQYQALYTPQTIAMIETTAESRAAQFAVLDASLDLPFNPEELNGPGLDLLRGQLLGFEGHPLGQIVFADATGQPIAFCLMQTDTADDTAFQSASLSGLESVSWTQDGYAYILIGDSSEDNLTTWAHVLQSKI